MATNDSTRPNSESGDAAVDRAAVRERLDRVYDPELDRSIVDLDYVETIAIDDGTVTVSFVLPTAWCSPAFAWMMATGIRDEVTALEGVASTTVRLRDHMHGEEIETGVNEGLAFESVFETAEDGIDEVRRKLDEKARFARQYEAVRALEAAGLDPEQIASLTRGDLTLEREGDHDDERAVVTVRDGVLSVTVDRDPLATYLEKATTTGLVTDASDLLFADRDGDPLDPDPETFEAVVRDARLAVSNIEGQGAICEALHESRNGTADD
jgi:metal-sulfur cluster biosynthetic enzyme